MRNMDMQTEEQRAHNEELQCLIDDVEFKASLLKIAEKALEDVLKIVTNAQKEIARIIAIECGEDEQ